MQCAHQSPILKQRSKLTNNTCSRLSASLSSSSTLLFSSNLSLFSYHSPKIFVRFGALHILIISYLLPSSSLVQSPVLVFLQSYSASSFLRNFPSNFLQASVHQATASGGFSFSRVLKEKLEPSLHSQFQQLVPTYFRPAVFSVGQHDFASAPLISGVSQTDHRRQLLKSLQRRTDVHEDKNKA